MSWKSNVCLGDECVLGNEFVLGGIYVSKHEFVFRR